MANNTIRYQPGLQWLKCTSERQHINSKEQMTIGRTVYNDVISYRNAHTWIIDLDQHMSWHVLPYKRWKYQERERERERGKWCSERFFLHHHGHFVHSSRGRFPSAEYPRFDHIIDQRARRQLCHLTRK